MFRMLLAVAILAVLAGQVLANVPEPARPFPPDGPPPNPRALTTKATVPVKIERADLAKLGKGVAAKIAIPRKVLARIAPGTPTAGEETKQSSLPWWSTLVAGIAMSIGAVGLLIAARGSKAARAVAAAALLVAMLAGGYAFAAKEPERERPVAAPAAELVIVEIVDGGEAVVITLSEK
jgi:hypothetical protein